MPGVVSPTTSPFLSTTIRSAISSDSFNLCEIKIIDFPDSFSDRIVLNNSSTSVGVRTAVGSSKINNSASLYNCFKISVRCFNPIGKSSTNIVGSIGRPNFLLNSSILAFVSFSSINGLREIFMGPSFTLFLVYSLPRVMFSPTENGPTN